MKKIFDKLISILQKKKEFVIAAVILIVAVAVAGSFLSVYKRNTNSGADKTAETEANPTEQSTERKDTKKEDNSGENANAETSDSGEYILPEISELRGVWFSYYDWIALQTEDEEEFRERVSQVMNEVVDMKFNTIFVHVHSHSDAYYESKYFPMSKYAAGSMGKKLSYDPLSIMIEEAHKKGIYFHGWMNPYRVTSDDGKTEDGALSFEGVSWEEIPKNSIVKKWYNATEHNRNVLYHDGNYFLNPSKDEVKEYLADSVEELVSNYDIDGVHFDDYFYPGIDDSDEALSFDLQEYESSGSKLSVADWRRQNVSETVQLIYKTVKAVNPEVEFGISPAGNLDNLRSDSMYFTDIDAWLLNEGYLDYVIPQIYWGFEQRNKDGSLSPSAYENCLNRWCELPKRDEVKLYIGLALYRCGLDIKDNNSVSEWASHSDIILRQVQALRSKENVSGFCLFDYRDLSRKEAKTEVENLHNFISQEKVN